MSHHRKNSVRDKEILRSEFNHIQREAHSRQSVGHCKERAQPWNLVWLVFIGWVTSYANQWEGCSNYSWEFSSVRFSCSVLSDSATSWTAACQASITNSRSSLKLMSIELVMPSNHLILCHPLLLHLQSFLHQGLFKWVRSLHQVAKVLEWHDKSL